MSPQIRLVPASPFLALALLAPHLLLAPVEGWAQEPAPAGFLFAYRPHAGERPSFEAGYRRHLQWHREARDSLRWFGWDVVVGSRPGLFVDGVFGTPFAALDVRVDPAGDQVDLTANVLPHAEPVRREMLVLRPEVSTATPLEDGSPTDFVEVVRYEVSAEGARAMDVAWEVLRRRAVHGELLPYTVYEQVAGAGPGFVLMIWRSRLATFDERVRDPKRGLRTILSGVEGASTASTDPSHTLARPPSSEVWMYRSDLTHLGTSEGR